MEALPNPWLLAIIAGAAVVIFAIIIVALVAAYAIPRKGKERERAAVEPAIRWKEPTLSTRASAALSASQAAPPLAPEALDNPPTQIVLGAEDDPWATIERYEKAEADQYQSIPLGASLMEGLNPIMTHAPMLALGGATAITRTYVIKLKPEQAKGLAAGALGFVRSADGGIRGMLRGSKGIHSHVSLTPATGMQLAGAITAVWQVMAIITAQKFLSDIDERLGRIEKRIEEIQRYLVLRDDAQVLGNLKYLQSIQAHLRDQGCDARAIHDLSIQLEQIDRECLQARLLRQGAVKQDHYTLQTQRLRSKLWANREDERELDALLVKVQHESNMYFAALSVQGFAGYLRHVLNPDDRLGSQRVRDLRDDVESFLEEGNGFYAGAYQRALQLGRIAGFNGIQLWQKVSASHHDFSSGTDPVRSELEGTIRAIEFQDAERAKPISLLVETDDKGKVSQVWKLLGEGATEGG